MNPTVQTMYEQINIRVNNEPLPVLVALGAKKIRYNEKSLYFNVNCDNFSGIVESEYDEDMDLYNVRLYKKSGKLLSEHFGIYAEDLAFFIWRQCVIV